jgi:hypothetical protein
MVDRAGTTRPMDLGLADEWGEWCRNPELGLYVAPASNGREWHGLHFISSGAFAGAVFAFAITIPAGCVGACSAHFRQPPGDATAMRALTLSPWVTDTRTRCPAADFSQQSFIPRCETRSWTCRVTQRSGPRKSRS